LRAMKRMEWILRLRWRWRDESGDRGRVVFLSFGVCVIGNGGKWRKVLLKVWAFDVDMLAVEYSSAGGDRNHIAAAAAVELRNWSIADVLVRMTQKVTLSR
jgi:hypothetical protein